MGGTVARRGELTIKRGPRSAAETCVRIAPASKTTTIQTRRRRARQFGLGLIASTLVSTAGNADETCPDGQILAGGAPDNGLFAAEVSRDIRAVWCEEYDELGRSRRIGAYREHYPSGLLRAEASYIEGRLAGPVVAYFANGSLFLRGVLSDGEWTGDFALYHENGQPWLRAEFAGGRLNGRVATHYPDGRLASETRFQNGREDGLARTFYPQMLGGGRRSETRVEADVFLAAPVLHPATVAAGPAREDVMPRPAAASPGQVRALEAQE